MFMGSLFLGHSVDEDLVGNPYVHCWLKSEAGCFFTQSPVVSVVNNAVTYLFSGQQTGGL